MNQCNSKKSVRARVSHVEMLESRQLLSVVTFNINSSLSSASGSGTTLGYKVVPQKTGSNTAKLSGTIQADLEPGSIRFTGGGSISAADTGSYQPGNEPANYAFQASTLFGTAYVAIRGAKASFSTSAIAVSSSGTFSSAGATYTLSAGTVAYDLPVIASGSKSLAGLSTTTLSTPSGKLSVSKSGLETLEMPFSVALKISVLSADDSTVDLQGTIVATVQLPTKPASVSGQVFNDLNGNGSKQSNEGGLAGYRVYIDTNNDGKWEASESSVLTGKNGDFELSGLAAGKYILRVVVPSGHKVTDPKTNGGVYTFTLTVGENLTGLEFGVH
jgi:hypothetical protein